MGRFLLSLSLCVLLAIGTWAQENLSSSQERELIDLINRERARHGLAALVPDDRMTQAARQHTSLMIEQNTLSHRLPGEPDLTHRLAATKLPFDASGENVAYNSDVPHAHEAFMNSPGHRANILKPEFNAVGVGIQRSGDLLWVTEEFARKLTVVTASEAVAIVAGRLRERREQAGLPAMAGVPRPELAEVACSMAHNDRLGAEGARHIPGARSVVEWTSGDPSKLPAQADGVIANRAFQKYSLGACYATSAGHPAPVFWFVMVVY